MKHWLAIGAVCLLPTEAAAQTLKETLTTAYEYSFEIRAQQQNTRAADEAYLEALSGWLPTVTASGSRGRSNRLFQGQRTEFPTGSDQLVVNQPIFNGGSTIAAVKGARAVVDQEQLKLFSAEQSNLLNAVQAHANVIQAKEILRVSKHTEAVLKKQLELVRVQFKAGEVTRTDVASVEKRYQERISQRITSEGDVAKAVSNYIRIVGTHPNNLEAVDLPEVPADLESVLTKALQFNPDLQISHKEWDQAKQKANAARGSLLPEVSVQGSKSWTHFREAFSVDDAGVVTLNVSIPLFQGGRNYAGYRKARDLQEAARENTRATHQTLIRTVSDAWHDLDSSKASIVAIEAAIKAADLALKSIMEEFKAGARSTLDVLDTERELFDEQVALLRQKNQAVIRSYVILSLMGELTPKNLGLSVEQFDAESHFKRTRFKIIGLK